MGEEFLRPHLEDIKTPEFVRNSSALEASTLEDLRAHLGEFDHDSAQKRALLLDQIQAIEQKANFAPKIFLLACAWLSGVFALLVLQGFGLIRLADSVLIAAISTTTLNVIGIFYIVAKNLFPKK